MLSTLVTILVLLALSACFSGSETAIFSLDPIRLKTLADKKNGSAIILEKLRNDPKKLLGTLLICNNAVNVGISALSTVLAIDLFGNAWLGAATGVITFLLVIFGEYMPKSYAAHHSMGVAFAVARPVRLLTVLLSPLVAVVESVVRLFLKYEETPRRHNVSEDDIRTMAKMGVKAGTLESGERELIEKVFLFNDITAADVMTPKEDVDYLDGRTSLAEALPLITKARFSRYPVHEGDTDKVVAILHIKDLLETLAERGIAGTGGISVGEAAATPMFVSETKPIDDLFRDFQRQRAHMAVVINEFGSTVGIVTVDDLLSELVGEIADESDVDEHVIKRVDKHTVVVHGDTEIGVINRFLNSRIPGHSGKTISRALHEAAGDIPAENEPLMLTDTLEATVEDIANLRIQRVRLRKIEQPSTPQK